jgi:GH15 family glucan-1,4-alpha-glucosidase
VDAIQGELVKNGFVYRYSTESLGSVDGLEGGEGAFLPCSFWLANDLALIGRQKEAEEMFERVLGVASDIGLFSEEYDPEGERPVGNFPQAFTHLAMVRTAAHLSGEKLPRVTPPGRRHAGAAAPDQR